MLDLFSRTTFLLVFCSIPYHLCQNPTTCKVPTVPPIIFHDPIEHAGVWYEYSAYTPGIIDYQCTNIFIPLGAGIENGVPYNWTISFRMKVPNKDPECIGICSVSNITGDGVRASATWFPDFGAFLTGSGPGKAPSLANVRYFVLYMDPFMQIVYRCNNASGDSCSQPFFFVNIRSKPTEAMPHLATYINKTTDNVLAPYCFSSSNFTLTDWTSNIPPCLPQWDANYTDCQNLIEKTRQKSSFDVWSAIKRMHRQQQRLLHLV
ncbi:uncharacterized protein LOC129586791 [Paramacrobiotus metropolitanus]|uniref:uncharacterized protein LOC129586791 n=1 Tax=Paramacrobiotus metropolitanus TaxID=2943436 RepID=UPI0024465774|nr:uncharacterized protein LOC129586791 [Paramacrobiotus metropolitanus]